MMMSCEERAKAIGIIQHGLPDYIFNRFVNVLTQVAEVSNDAIVYSLSRIMTESSYAFYYRMKETQDETTITPLREILDLLEGWIITSHVQLSPVTHRTIWYVKSIYSN